MAKTKTKTGTKVVTARRQAARHRAELDARLNAAAGKRTDAQILAAAVKGGPAKCVIGPVPKKGKQAERANVYESGGGSHRLTGQKAVRPARPARKTRPAQSAPIAPGPVAQVARLVERKGDKFVPLSKKSWHDECDRLPEKIAGLERQVSDLKKDLAFQCAATRAAERAAASLQTTLDTVEDENVSLRHKLGGLKNGGPVKVLLVVDNDGEISPVADGPCEILTLDLDTARALARHADEVVEYAMKTVDVRVCDRGGDDFPGAVTDEAKRFLTAGKVVLFDGDGNHAGGMNEALANFGPYEEFKTRLYDWLGEDYGNMNTVEGY